MRTYISFALVIGLLKHTVAFPPAGLDMGASRTRRDVTCREEEEYQNGNICCLNCPAGTHVKSPCTTSGTKGQCEECEYGTYTEHSNGLKQCFKCTQCRSDQEVAKQCTHTHNRECRCKPGRFCDPDQACEVCKKCSRCEIGEKIVRNCTSTTNTECKKIERKESSTSVRTVVIVLCILPVVLVCAVIMIVCYKKRQTGSQRNLPDVKKTGQACTSPMVRAVVDFERERLCETPSDSASSSQNNLDCLPPPASCPPTLQVYPVTSGLPNKREFEFPTLIPENGEQSLKDCFKYFEELDMRLYNKFFRHLGINDNAIKSTEHLPHDDRIHDLLKVWMEKEGRRANLNDLLRGLVELKQRRTAEIIMGNAIEDGHYKCMIDDEL